MIRRFTLAIITAVIWSQITYHFLPSGWVLVGAGIIGILFTIGLPRRRHELGRTRSQGGLGPRWRRNHA